MYDACRKITSSPEREISTLSRSRTSPSSFVFYIPVLGHIGDEAPVERIFVVVRVGDVEVVHVTSQDKVFVSPSLGSVNPF